MRPNKVEYYRRPEWNPYKNPQKRKQPFPQVEWKDNSWEGAGWVDYSGGDGSEHTGGEGDEYQGGDGSEYQGGYKRKKFNKGQQRRIWWQKHKDRKDYAGGVGVPSSYINVPPKASGGGPPDSDMVVEVGSGGGAISNFPPIPPGMPGVNGMAAPAPSGTGEQYVLTFICCRGCVFYL